MAKRSNTAQVEQETIVEQVTEVAVVQRDEKGRKKEVNVSKESLETMGLKTKSQVIRYLIGENFSPSAVAKFLDIRYQHVRNVMTQQLKRPIDAPTAIVQEVKTDVE